MLFGLFARKEDKILSRIGVDVHSHLIPEIDDGAKDYEISLLCIREIVKQGVKKIYITPHFQTRRFNNDEDDVRLRFEELKVKVADAKIDVDMQLAGEYLIDDGFRGRMESDKKFLAINDKYLLVEFSFNQSMMGMEELFFDLQMLGYEIILAHPERYSYFYTDSNLLTKFKEQGVYFQSNILSFGGFYGRDVMKRAYAYVEKGWIDFLGTDMHTLRYRDALENTCKKSKFQKMMRKYNFLNNQL